jgi:Aldehyde:ferredoxin oxidoreductase
VRGTHGIQVADPKTLNELSFNITKEAQGPHTSKYRILGTSTNVLNMNKLGLLPTRNYQEGVFEGVETISGEYLHEHNKVKTIACAQCPIACEQMSMVKTGPWTGAMTGIEYECLFANSSNLGIDDINTSIKLIHIADSSGMDAMSMGITISWAMETFEKGIFKKEDFKCEKFPEGFELTFGNCEAAVATAEMIRDREGIGKLLGEGTRSCQLDD